jgi:hypothetical protein
LVVEAQLGRTLRGSWGVAARCHLGLPTVIVNHPRLEDGSPFPTTYWLTCPILAKRISALESAGWLTRLSDRLSSDQPFRQRLVDAIADYIARRDEMESIEDAGSPPGGGPDRVKCAHAHVAHELVSGLNPVGALALSETGYSDCAEPCFSVTQ